MRVSLFITCLTDTFYPRVGVAVVKVLEHFGCQVDFPPGQTCCGQPMYNNGFHDEAAPLARRMVRCFEHSQYVVTPSGSCAAMVRDYYPSLLANDPAYAQGARQLAEKTHEFIQFLATVLKVDLAAHQARWPGHVTYHYSCHLRGLGVPAPHQPAPAGGTTDNDTVRLLRQIAGLRYAPLERPEQCCGFGGMFAMKYPAISGAMLRDKLAAIRAAAAAVVVSNDAGCTMNLSGACHRHGVDVRFKHAAEVIAESLGLLAATGGDSP